jgi:hypothetical protein
VSFYSVGTAETAADLRLNSDSFVYKTEEIAKITA